MIEDKGLDAATADKIGEYVQLSGRNELVDELLKNEHLCKSPSAIKGLEAMKLLLTYCKLMRLNAEIIFDLSLARGLDYYTGVIYEAVLKSEPLTLAVAGGDETGTVGSIAGGGRYDNLVGMFDPRGKQVPCVGVSIGVERIFSVLEAKYAAQGTISRTNDIEVYVASAHKGLLEKRLKIISELWSAGIRAEHSYKSSPKLLVQLQHCENNGIPLALVFGDLELERGVVKLREVISRKEHEISIDNLVDDIRKHLTLLNAKNHVDK